jgi:hypothetical protein
MIPLAEILRTRAFPLSPTKISPAASTAMPVGLLSCALTAGPPSPEYPALEVPATSVSIALFSSLKTQLEALKYTFPALSVAIPEIPPSGTVVAATGLGKGAPPATVEITYCCAATNPAHNTNAENSRPAIILPPEKESYHLFQKSGFIPDKSAH